MWRANRPHEPVLHEDSIVLSAAADDDTTLAMTPFLLDAWLLVNVNQHDYSQGTLIHSTKRDTMTESNRPPLTFAFFPEVASFEVTSDDIGDGATLTNAK